jgi:linoleoyl-CoA desaturase
MLSTLRKPKARLRAVRPVHYTDSFEALQGEFRRRGWYRKATGTILLQYAAVVGMLFAGVAVFVFAPSYVAKALGLILAGMGGLGVSTQAHTASHGATSDRPWVNRLLTYFGYPFLLGLPTTCWRHKHLVTHHKAPNVEGFDEDIELLPLFALTAEEVRRAGPWARFYYRHVQWLLVLPAIALNGFNTLRYGWGFLAGQLARKETRTAAAWLDVAALLGHVVLWFVLPMLFFSPGQVVLAYVLRMMLTGYGMFAAFAPAHFPAEAVVADNGLRYADFVLRQTATTVNFRTGPIGRLLCAGVEFQIEHHLFPNICHVHYPQVSRLVREYCERHGYPYRTLGWGEGILKSLWAFACPKPVVKELAGQAD